VTYCYSTYGLCLESPTAIEGLSLAKLNCEASGADRIRVTIGECPTWATAALQLPAELVYVSPVANGHPGTTFQLSRLGGGQFFRLSYSDGSRFVVDAETRRIWGACQPPLTQEDLVTYLVGPVLGFVLRRRGVLALHASSFCKGGLAFALCGGAGAGKSTTAAALALQGCPIQSEDITALRERDGFFRAASGYPRVNLWPESTSNLFGSPKALPEITPNWEKRYLPLDGAMAEFENQERQLAAVYLLEPRSNNEDVPRIEDISPREAAFLLVRNTYMNYLLDKQQRASEFDAVARLVSGTAMRRLIPHSDPAKIGAMCELLQTDSADTAGRIIRADAGRPI
jgi:hypothetical protein